MGTLIKNCQTWKDALAEEKQKPYFQEIFNFLKREESKGKIIYPKSSDIFNALKLTPLEKVKVVIIGQDPYHGPRQAHGLCFSVQKGVAIPPSLQNIYKEIHNDLGLPIPSHGDLSHWAEQGVLLLNATLTVEAHKADSHSHIGWQQFTDKIIETVNQCCEGVIFLLWGSYAQKKAFMIDPTKHYILKAPHPSPLSAHRGFLGCKHFSKANELLRQQNKTEIDWRVS